MKSVIKEISRGKNLEKNLPQYANYLADLYNKTATVLLTMDYYTYYEMLEDMGNGRDTLKSYVNILNEIIRNNFIEKKKDIKREEVIFKINRLRDDVYKRVDILAAYADIFSRYEYVSNRCEYLFKNTDLDSKYSDEDFTKQIMQYIFSEEDNSLINSKICDIIAEVPLRLTKSKFFQLLDEGMSVYNQTDKQTVDDFVYLLKSSSMILIPDNIEEFQDLYEIYLFAKELNYDTITEKQFQELEQKLRYAATFIEEETNLYTMLQGLINRSYVMLLSFPYINADTVELSGCHRIIKAINEQFQSGDYITLSDEITELFSDIEGMPEELHAKLSSSEYILDSVKEQYIDTVRNIKSDQVYQDLFLSQYLLSDSLFIDLTQVQNLFDDTSDVLEEFDIKLYVIQKRDELISELMNLFKNNQRIVNRSVMALILSRLPVFFNNVTEIQDYVYNAFSNCTNKAEKVAVIEIIKCIINEI